jgi:hypothetical protein
MAKSKSLNKNLHGAKRNKRDEFYTQLEDIERELSHYAEHFRGKVVYCNCDDPRVSNFFHYFTMRFEQLGLKKLITTCYKNNNADLFSMNDAEKAIWLEYNGDRNENGVPDPEEIGINHLKGDGDFRSKETIELLKQADIVVTNPPFSLFREYVAQLIEYDKKFIIVGSRNAITYKEIFKHIKENNLWLGNGFKNGNAYFEVPDYNDEYAEGVYDENTKLVKFRNVIWYTNIDHNKRHEKLILTKEYNPEEYPTYDNYDAIEVSKVANIPTDYEGAMGVPITFLDKYNPEQFEILGITAGRDEFEAKPIKKYINPKQLNPNGSIGNGSKVNTRATLLLDTKPNGITYTADNIDGYLSIYYARIIIKQKNITAKS